MQILLGKVDGFTTAARNRTVGAVDAVMGGMSVPSGMPDI
jgi:hypothetical protein